MIYLIQILKLLSNHQKNQFLELFSDLDYEINELGYKGEESQLVNDMLFNHFGFTIDDEQQLRMITKVILKPDLLKSAINVSKGVLWKNNPRKKLEDHQLKTQRREKQSAYRKKFMTGT